MIMKKAMVVMGVCACLCLSGCIPPRYITAYENPTKSKEIG
jgi:hypothetical protein